MTDWSRLTDYIIDYFPEPTYTRKDIQKWAKENVPAWKGMKRSDKKEVLNDWEYFVESEAVQEIEEVITEELEDKPISYIRNVVRRVKKFLGRLF